MHSLKYVRSITLKCTDIGFIKPEFVAKTQFLCYKIHDGWSTVLFSC